MIRRSYLIRSSYGNTSFQSGKMIKYYFYIFFGKIFYFILLIASVIIMNISISNKNFENSLRQNILFISKPIYVIIELPFNLIFDFIIDVKNLFLTNFINKNLKEENIILRKLYLESKDIKTENENLKNLLNFKDRVSNNFDYISSHVYSNTKTGMNNLFIINLGTEDGVQEGNLVIGINRSVIGRVIDVNKRFSNILLLNDINSRIPARIVSTQERIILAGTNNGYLEISYFNSKTPNIMENDLVFTSGDSDILPDGFLIGTIKKKGEKFVVEMSENLKYIFNVMIITPKVDIIDLNNNKDILNL